MTIHKTSLAHCSSCMSPNCKSRFELHVALYDGADICDSETKSIGHVRQCHNCGSVAFYRYSNPVVRKAVREGLAYEVNGHLASLNTMVAS